MTGPMLFSSKQMGEAEYKHLESYTEKYRFPPSDKVAAFKP